MSAPMSFSGVFCFSSAEALEEALDCLGAVVSVLSKDKLSRRHLTLELSYETTAPSAMWIGTLRGLEAASELAWAGAITCRYGTPPEVETRTVAAPSRARDIDASASGASRWWIEGAAAARARSVVPFDREQRNILVVYALADGQSEPVPGTPAWVVGDLGALEADLLLSDAAPYITVTSDADLLSCLDRGIARAGVAAAQRDALREAREWAVRVGAQWFGHQLEPPLIAGDGTARALGLEDKQRSDEEDDEPGVVAWVHRIEPPPRARCLVCGGTQVEVRRESLGAEVLLRCTSCDAFDLWSDEELAAREAADLTESTVEPVVGAQEDWVEIPAGPFVPP